MSTPDPSGPRSSLPTVFLSYASEDRQAALGIRDALPGYGLEVWYDESALEGGDAWDQKIRRQIRECDYFMPVISARTETRHEGYFRREWRLAVERTLDMADDHTFLLPVVIDETAQSGARVPDKFLAVQWTRLPGGQPTAAFESLCRRLASGGGIGARPARAPIEVPRGKREAAAAVPHYPEFPREEPGQKVRFWALVVAWPFQSLWALFNRFPKWIRICLYLWLFVVLLSKGCTGWRDDDDRRSPATPTPSKKLKQLAQDSTDGPNEADVAKLGMQMAQQFSGAALESTGAAAAGAASPLVVIPFTAAKTDRAARKLAVGTFGQVYGRLAISQHGKVGLVNQPVPAGDDSGAVELGRARHAKYVLTGSITEEQGAQNLTVKVLSVGDGSVVWSKSYPVADADPAKIAVEVDAKVTGLPSG